jgi:hypothetical protein
MSIWFCSGCWDSAAVRQRGLVKSVLRLICFGLSVGSLTLMAGCGKSSHSVEHAEVTGKVLFNGKPLPGGKVTFVAVQGGFAASGNIDENGAYQISAPIGEVEIGVDNQMLRPRGGPRQIPHPQQPGSGEQGPPLKGRWMDIPAVYSDPHTSGLKYTVQSGAQTHPIELSVRRASSPGMPAQ